MPTIGRSVSHCQSEVENECDSEVEADCDSDTEVPTEKACDDCDACNALF